MQVYHFADKYNLLDVSFRDYLQGKSVAVVGCSGLDNVEQGEYIDSHDVVVRVHRPVPYAGFNAPVPEKDKPKWHYPPFVPMEWQSRIGAKVNVFYHKEFHVINLERWLPAFQEAGGRFLCLEYLENLWPVTYCKVRKYAPVRYLTNDHFVNVMEVIQGLPYAGSLIIGDILRHDIKSLYITDFPMFHKLDGTLISDRWVHENKEMNYMNLAWLRSLCESYDSISADTNMRTIFERTPPTWDVSYA